MDDESRRHLKPPSIFHYVTGGIVGLFSYFPLFHVFFGLMFVLMSPSGECENEAFPAALGVFTIIVLNRPEVKEHFNRPARRR